MGELPILKLKKLGYFHRQPTLFKFQKERQQAFMLPWNWSIFTSDLTILKFKNWFIFSSVLPFSNSKKDFSKRPFFLEIGLFSWATWPFWNSKTGLFIRVAYLFLNSNKGLFSWVTCLFLNSNTGLFLWATCPFKFKLVYFYGRPVYSSTNLFWQATCQFKETNVF